MAKPTFNVIVSLVPATLVERIIKSLLTKKRKREKESYQNTHVILDGSKLLLIPSMILFRDHCGIQKLITKEIKIIYKLQLLKKHSY